MRIAVVAGVCVVALGLLSAAERPGDGTSATDEQDSSGPRPCGIAERVAWTASRVSGSPEPPPPYRAERAFPKLDFQRPVDFTTAPGSDRLFVVELKGKIYSFLPEPDGERPDLFFDLAAHIEGHRRTYGIAFHPEFEKNRYVFISYVLAEWDPNGSRVSRFRVTDDDPHRCDPDSEVVLLEWLSGGHNGACLKFGPDGYLYVSTGDGSNPSPPDQRDAGQDVGNLLAAILRIDVDRPDGDKPYSIPPDNPFIDLEGARPEIWAYGLRNPWKMSFDPKGGDLWVGDVGWEMWEMVYRVERGGNYGWSVVEGPQTVRPEAKRGPTPILPPTVEHSHTESRSLTGGVVYHGRQLEDLRGAYLYGDYVTGKIWGLRHDGTQVTWQQELADTPIEVISFGTDYDDELLILDYGGTFHRLVPNTAASELNRRFPQTLSETGLFESAADLTLAPGVIPYSINAEPWSDHAVAVRCIGVPGTDRLGVYHEQNLQVGNVKGAWKYPADTVFAKTLSLEMERGNPDSRRRIETQILHRDSDTWRAYTYAWNDEQTDAVLVPAGGFDQPLTILDPDEPGGKRQQSWHFASRAECIVCHTTRAGSIQGFNVSQLNRPHDYRGIEADQLRTLSHIGLFEEPLPDPLPTLPSPFDAGVSRDERARSYLHVNCGQCHRRGGGGTARFQLQFELSLAETELLGEPPTQGAFGIEGAEIVAPGAPYRSVLLYRMAKLGRGRMPYSGSNLVDVTGLHLIHDWIAGLPPAENSPRLERLHAEEERLVERLAAPGGFSIKPLDRLLGSTSGAMRLLRLIDEGHLPEPHKSDLIARVTTDAAPEVRDLFERFLPEGQRVKRLGTAVDPAEILALRGDAASGERLFFHTAGVQCQNCHRINDQGRELGPDLSRVGKKLTREQILEEILEPSKRIDREWVAYLVETVEGRIHSGLLVSRGKDEVVLRDLQNQLIRIPADQIEQLVAQKKSIMPELLLQDLTPRQAADLIEYLSSLK